MTGYLWGWLGNCSHGQGRGGDSQKKIAYCLFKIDMRWFIQLAFTRMWASSPKRWRNGLKLNRSFSQEEIINTVFSGAVTLFSYLSGVFFFFIITVETCTCMCTQTKAHMAAHICWHDVCCSWSIPAVWCSAPSSSSPPSWSKGFIRGGSGPLMCSTEQSELRGQGPAANKSSHNHVTYYCPVDA